MIVNLFGIGTESDARAITAQKRINCYVELRQEGEKGRYVLVGRPGLTSFCDSIGASPSRGMWAVNTLSQPTLFSVHGNTLYAVNNAGMATSLGTIGTTQGDVSMQDDGVNLAIVDGTSGYYYNMLAPAGLTQITDGNFPSSPKYLTWQDTYFVVADGASNQFGLSDGNTVSSWPAQNIGFAQTGTGPLQAAQADHGILNFFGDVYAEFWQVSGSPDLPVDRIPGAAQEFGLSSPWSLTKFDNSLVGLFKNRMGGVNVSRLNGFSLQRLSDEDIETLLQPVIVTATAQGYAFMSGGHPFYVLNLPDADLCLMYDGTNKIWSQLQSYGYSNFRGFKFANFANRLLVSDRYSGEILQFDSTVYDDDGDPLVMEVQSQHIWGADKFVGIKRIQIDFQQGVGTATGQGANPVVELQVSKDGGNSFYSVGYSSIGRVGEFTIRSTWNSLGAARDWVLRLRVSDPVQRVITGATAELTEGSF